MYCTTQPHADPPSIPHVRIRALNFTSAAIIWEPPADNPLCVQSYSVLVIRDNSTCENNMTYTHVYNTNDTNLTLTDLVRGEEYSITVV